MPRIQPQLPMLDKYASVKKQQEQLLREHAVFKQDLDKKQDDVRLKQGDLDVAGRVLKVLDSNVPKSARQFLNTQLAQSLGVGAKSEQFKGANSMVMGLDPGSLMNLRSQFAQQIEGAPPGRITDMTKGLMTGQLPLDQFLNQVDLTGGSGQDTMAGGEVGDDQLQQPAQPAAATAQPFNQGPGAVQSFEGQRTVPPSSQQASPMLMGALGLDSRVRLRNNDLIQQGYRVPLDAKDQEKLAESLTNRSVGLSSTISEAANMVDLFKGKPEVLGPVGSIARNVQSTVRQVEGVLNLIKPGTSVEQADESTKGLARNVGNIIAKAHKLDMTAENSARIEGMVLGLAYRMAVANDIPGNRLTNGIIQQNLAQLGRSASPEQFSAVLRDTIEATTREFDEHVRRTVGVSGSEVLARQLTDADIKRMAASGDILPQNLALALRDEVAGRLRGEPRNQIKPMSPTLEEEEQTLGRLETEKKARDLEKTQQDMTIDKNRDTRAASADQRAEQREDRMASAQERQAKIEADRLAFQMEEAEIDNQRADNQAQLAGQREDRLTAATEESQKLQRDQFEYKKIQDRKEEEAQNRQAIAAAFSQFAKAIANLGSSGSIGGGGVPNLGGNQDTSAFRITPGPQRQAPRPAGGS